MFSRWLGPANVVEQMSPHSYIVEYNGVIGIYMQIDSVNTMSVSKKFLLGHFKVILKLMRPRLNTVQLYTMRIKILVKSSLLILHQECLNFAESKD